MKTVPNSNRIVRLDADTHRRAKILSASEGIPLSTLVGKALARELARRARRLDKDDPAAIAMATEIPAQTR